MSLVDARFTQILDRLVVAEDDQYAAGILILQFSIFAQIPSRFIFIVIKSEVQCQIIEVFIITIMYVHGRQESETNKKTGHDIMVLRSPRQVHAPCFSLLLQKSGHIQNRQRWSDNLPSKFICIGVENYLHRV